MIRVGDLRSRISIQRQSTQKNGVGQSVQQWVQVVPSRARIRHQSGREYLKSSAEQSQGVAEVVLRYSVALSGFNASHRVVCLDDDRVFDVEDYYITDKSPKWLVIKASVGQ